MKILEPEYNPRNGMWEIDILSDDEVTNHYEFDNKEDAELFYRVQYVVAGELDDGL